MLQHVTRPAPLGLLRFALLLLAIVAVAASHPAPASSQGTPPQCSDGIDNDSDNAADSEDAGCSSPEEDDESDSPYSGVVVATRALPVVVLQGSVGRSGAVAVSKLFVRGNRGTIIDIKCAGRRCPFKHVQRSMITGSLRIRAVERRLRPPMVLRMRLQVPGQLGKYIRYNVRRRKPPVRTDSCLDPITRKVRGCFTG
jgi:hypothetical protein